MFILVIKFSDQFAHEKMYYKPKHESFNPENVSNNIAIVTIATGGYSAHELISSLRNEGRWNKNIYLFADNCTTHEENVIELKKFGNYKSIDSKLFKMDILLNTTEDYILYLDSDIIALRSVYDLLKRIGPWKEICDVYLSSNMWYSSKNFIWNSGVILAKRNKSEKFLNLWKNTIKNKNYQKTRDRSALRMVIESGEVNACLLSKNTVKYTADISGNLRSIKPPIFQHFVTRKTNVKKCY